MRTMTWWKKNILAVVIALALSVAIFFAVQNTDNLFANVAWVGEKSPTFSEQSDIGSYIDANGAFAVRAAKRIENIESMSLLLIFDDEEVSIQDDDFTSDFSLNYASAGKGRGELVIPVHGDLEEGALLLKLRGQGDVTSIVLGDTVAHFVWWGTERLSVATQGK